MLCQPQDFFPKARIASEDAAQTPIACSHGNAHMPIVSNISKIQKPGPPKGQEGGEGGGGKSVGLANGAEIMEKLRVLPSH